VTTRRSVPPRGPPATSSASRSPAEPPHQPRAADRAQEARGREHAAQARLERLAVERHRLDRRRARPDVERVEPERGVAQLGERASERVAPAPGQRRRRLGHARAPLEAGIEDELERREREQRGAALAVGGGRDEQRQAGVEALGLARRDDRGEAVVGRGHNRVVETVDARGLACPLPLALAKRAIAALADGDRLVVLATDPEAPIDLAAWAADEGHAHAWRDAGGHQEHVLRKRDGT
jgi:tRNA 2-thiouridine synthesizing protein A